MSTKLVMLKKVVFVLALLFIGSSSTAWAQARQGSDSNLKTSTISGLNRARVASGKTLLPEVRQNNIRALFEKMISKFEAATIRLEGLIEKIDVRLTNLKGINPDLNTVQQEADLALAKTQLENAKTNIQNAKIQLENLVFSDVPSEEFKELRELIKEVKSELQTVHSLLGKLVRSIKGFEKQFK